MLIKNFWLFMFLSGVLLMTQACKTDGQKKHSYDLVIGEMVPLENIPSGSGISLVKGTAYIISDNANGFYVMDTLSYLQRFFSFKQGDSMLLQHKSVKEDFENGSIVGQQFIAFGSGSIEGSRENILIIPVDSPGHQHIIPAKKFYNSLKTRINISTQQLNLEGSFSTADSFYLLNRGTNHLVGMSIEQLVNITKNGSTETGALSALSFSFPIADSFPIGFSGACYYKDNMFLFTASIERTNNWIEDGTVAGSYIGIANLNGQILQLLPLKDSKGIMLKEKLESLEFTGEDGNGTISLFAVADNDNGKSTWFKLKLQRNQL